MKFNGFRSIAEYESECARLHYSTTRIPFHRGNEKYFILVTGSPNYGNKPGTVCSWHLFDIAETKELLDGIIDAEGAVKRVDKKIGERLRLENGLDADFLGPLVANGFFPDTKEAYEFAEVSEEDRIAIQRKVEEIEHETIGVVGVSSRDEAETVYTDTDSFGKDYICFLGLPLLRLDKDEDLRSAEEHFTKASSVNCPASQRSVSKLITSSTLNPAAAYGSNWGTSMERLSSKARRIMCLQGNHRRSKSIQSHLSKLTVYHSLEDPIIRPVFLNLLMRRMWSSGMLCPRSNRCADSMYSVSGISHGPNIIPRPPPLLLSGGPSPPESTHGRAGCGAALLPSTSRRTAGRPAHRVSAGISGSSKIL